MSENVCEYNFDGLIGPTHHFGGLAFGNTASDKHRFEASSPRRAALQGLDKMKRLLKLGVPQGFFLPQERPDFEFLRQRGYSGTEQQILDSVGQKDFNLLLTAYSASSMWAANAATVSPSADTHDQKVHFTPANLRTHPHRSIETGPTAGFFDVMFPDPVFFSRHTALADEGEFFDEGAANHMRLCGEYGGPGVEVFVYGKSLLSGEIDAPRKFPARQSLEAGQRIAGGHGLSPERTVFVRQRPEAVEAGVFHNDVIAMSNRNVLIYHEDAYCEKSAFLDELIRKFRAVCSRPLFLIEISASQMTVDEAVSTYFFNSQLVCGATEGDDSMTLIAPVECEIHSRVRDVIDGLIAGENPVAAVEYVDLTQSMYNGGGPACLRLRVPLSEPQARAVHPAFVLDGPRAVALQEWVSGYYRDELRVDDLRDYALVKESRAALDRLTALLETGRMYSFQK